MKLLGDGKLFLQFPEDSELKKKEERIAQKQAIAEKKKKAEESVYAEYNSQVDEFNKKIREAHNTGSITDVLAAAGELAKFKSSAFSRTVDDFVVIITTDGSIRLSEAVTLMAERRSGELAPKRKAPKVVSSTGMTPNTKTGGVMSELIKVSQVENVCFFCYVAKESNCRVVRARASPLNR